jgi:hypothetical protein
VVHFTSSAIRNGWLDKVATFTRNIGLAENLEQLGFAGALLGWKRMDPPVFGAADPAGGEARPLRARLRREPVVIPTTGWANQHTIRPPEWMYQVAPLRDTRSDDVRFAGLASAGFTDVLGPALPDAPVPPPEGSTTTSLVQQPDGPYSVATALHAANVDGAAVTRTLVFANNIGVVTFSRSAPTAPLAVQMAVYFVRAHPASDDEKPQAYVVHASFLSPTLLAAPAHVGGG